MTNQPGPEFSRRVTLDRLARVDGPLAVAMEADGAECAALAERFGLVRLDRLTASVEVERRSGTDLVIVSGTLSAEIVQTCVVSLEPVAAHLEAPFSAAFTEADEDGVADESDGLAGDLAGGPGDSEDDPEPIAGDAIDLGELVAQHLSLALDPYPRAPGAEFGNCCPDEGAAGSAHPFAALGALRTSH